MLTKHLMSIPLTKFVVIKDSLPDKGKRIFDFILHNQSSPHAHYFVFEDNFERTKIRLKNCNATFHDMTTKLDKVTDSSDIKQFEEIVFHLESRSTVFIDSLVHLIYKYGLRETYKCFNQLMNEPKIAQIVTVLHTDLLEDSEQVETYFNHLATFSIKLEGKYGLSDKSRVSYTFKKTASKIIKQIEEYWFENATLKTKQIEKPDVNKIIETDVNPVTPENMSTFKIALTEQDKQLRDQVVLPYLPKSKQNAQSSEGSIIYHLDDIDDWDEEDPDDDLDI